MKLEEQKDYQSEARRTITDKISKLQSQKHDLDWQIKALEKVKQSTHIIGNKVIFEKKDILHFNDDLGCERSNLIVTETDYGFKHANLGHRSFSKYDISMIEEFISELQQTLVYMNEVKCLMKETKE